MILHVLFAMIPLVTHVLFQATIANNVNPFSYLLTQGFFWALTNVYVQPTTSRLQSTSAVLHVQQDVLIAFRQKSTTAIFAMKASVLTASLGLANAFRVAIPLKSSTASAPAGTSRTEWKQASANAPATSGTTRTGRSAVTAPCIAQAALRTSCASCAKMASCWPGRRPPVTRTVQQGSRRIMRTTPVRRRLAS